MNNMKKIFLAVMVAMALPGLSKTPKKVTLIGSKLDVEALGKNINLKQDISQLGISDLRILRNAFAARQGYCFMDYDMRRVFEQTSWYDSLLYRRFETDDTKPLKYTKAEQAFIQRIKSREAELCRQNFVTTDGSVVNTANIVNTFQLEAPSKPLYDRLAHDGFAIVPRTNIQLFHCYENNDYHDFPNFLTTDMHLQLFHMYFSNLLRDVEENRLAGLLADFNHGMKQHMDSICASTRDKRLAQTARWCADFFAIGCRLGGDSTMQVPASDTATVNAEMSRIKAATDDFSSFLGYTQVQFMYSLFKPRGYYTHSEQLSRYFRSMMWMQYASGCLDCEEQLSRYALMASVLVNDNRLRTMLQRISSPIDMLVGPADGVSVLDAARQLQTEHGDIAKLLKRKKLLRTFQQTLLAQNKQKARIRPKEQISCAEKISLLPQRYLYDAEVMQELVDTQTKPETRRGYPKALDVMAAMGVDAAERVLMKELHEADKWGNYASRLDSLKRIMPQQTKDSTLYNMWCAALVDMQKDKNPQQPYFMKTPQWEKKKLNTALASWTELKHDVILYAKQPMGAECGGMIPDPVAVGYVEPNVGYWKQALKLIDKTTDVLRRQGLLTDRAENLAGQLKENTQFMLRISEKELKGERLTDEEFNSIEKMGSTYEYLTLDIVKRDSTYAGMMWEDVSGPDRSLACVTDVYTANASNNPDRGVLHEAVGYADDIYVVVEINGLLYLTRGSVFSHREFHTPLGTRLTDEQWQQMLERSPRYGVPSWMDEITIKEPVPADNELIFYSSGC